MELRADVPTVAAALAASLTASDARYFRGFSPLTFETLLDGVTSLPPASELAGTLRPFLTSEDKAVVMRYLVSVAAADDEVTEAERRELQEVATALGTELPALTVSSVRE